MAKEMNEITINVSDYLSDDEMKEIAREEFREIIKRQFSDENQTERIISNTAYRIVWERVDEVIGGKSDVEIMLLEKVKKIIDVLSVYEVFREADSWRASATEGQKILNKAVSECGDIIFTKVKEIAEALPDSLVVEAISESINNKLGANNG